MIGWYMSRGVGMVIGFAYPAYASFKAIESVNKEDDTQWLTYWTVFSFFTVFEFFSDVVLEWFPFYYELKLAFIVWLQLPQTLGAKFVYESFIAPFLKKHELHIDQRLNEASARVTEKVGQAAEAVKDRLGDEVQDAVRKTMKQVMGGEEKKSD